MLLDSSAAPGARARMAWGALVALAIAAVAALAALAAQRVGYRFELEWMEGAMVDHAERVRLGQSLYAAPTAEHVPFLYTPMLFWLGALLSWVTGPGYLPLRLVSLAAFAGCALLIAAWTRRETGSRAAGLVAAGLLCAGYGYLRSWYDLARNDTLMLLGILATAWLLRFGGRRAAALAGLTATFAFLGKQSAVMWLPALGVGVLCVDWRRAVVFAASCAFALGGTVLGLHLATEGWFTFYVFEMPRHHGWQGEYKLRFFTSDLVPILPLVALALIACGQRWRWQRGQALLLAALAGGGLLTSYLSRLHVGGYDNVLLPAFAIGCLLAPIAARHARGAPLRGAALALLTAQFALLTIDVRAAWEPERDWWLAGGSRLLPTTAHEKANQQLVAFLAQQQGRVFVPFHGHLAALAGKPRMAHAQAIHDLLQALPRQANGQLDLGALARPDGLAQRSDRVQRALTTFYGSVTEALRSHSISTIVLDLPIGPVFEELFRLGLQQGGYQRRPGELLSEPPALQPAVGMITHSPYALTPTGK